MERSSFLGYPVDNLSINEALSWIEDAVSSQGSKTIAVINANKLWQSSHNIQMSKFLKSADLIIPEYAVVWGATRLDVKLNHIGGIMLLKAFLPFVERKQISPYFLGAKAEVVQRMVEKIYGDYPALNISGFHHGYISDEKMKNTVIKDIERKNPDVLFVAMGSPKQEYLMSELKNILNIPVLMGVGGSFDVLSGNKKDAPFWARSKGIEWLYRIFQDPLNLEYSKRYLITNTWLVWQVMKKKKTALKI